MNAMNLSKNAMQTLSPQLVPAPPKSIEGDLSPSQQLLPDIEDRHLPPIIQPKLALPSKDRISQDKESQLLNMSPLLEVPNTPIPNLLQLQSQQRESRPPQIPKRIHLVPHAEESVAYLDTILLFAVRPKEITQQQQDIFIDAMLEDTTRRATLRIPAIALTPEQQAKPDQRQVIASTAGSAAIAGAGDLINAVLRYLINVVMTNIVSLSIFGIYTAISTFAIIVSSIAVLGLDNTMLRFLSTYRAKGEYGLAAGVVRFVVWMTLISSLICGVLFYLSATTIAHLIYHQDAYAIPLKQVVLLVPLMALQLILPNGLMALKAIKWKIYTDRLIQPGLSLVLVVVFYFLGLRLEALILATICGYLASVITGQVLLRKASKQLVSDAIPRFEPKVWLHFALPMCFHTFIQNVLNSTDVLFLAAFTTAAQVGLYAAAERASIPVYMPLVALNTIFSPLIAEYYARGEYEQLTSMSRVVTKWSFSLSLPLFLCCCVFHNAILSIFGREYIAAGTVLIILSFGNLVDAGVGSVWNLLMMTGRTRIILANTTTALTVNILLSFLLVPRFNVIGAAVATALAVIILNVAGFIEVYCILKIFMLRWDMLKPVLAGGVASIVGLVLLHVIHVGYGFQAIFGVLGLVIPFMLVYALVLILLRLSKEDMMVLDAVRAKFGKKQPA
jgi:O-antigen/teichoic acid export membrane protein